MLDIITLTLNPALDLSTAVPRVVAGPKLRCGPEVAEPGGGGVNVARAVMQLGGQARAMVALSGPTGEALAALLEARGLPLERIEAPGETRHSFAVTDTSSAEQYRFVLPGPRWSDAQLGAALDHLASRAASDAIVVLSGSMPPGADPQFATRACAALGAGRHVVIDTSGATLAALAMGASPCPDTLRMDHEEAETIAAAPLATREASATFADTLRQRGAALRVIIARGADGSVLAGPEGCWHATAADVPVVSKIGAGDSFVGGYVLGLAQGLAPQEALRLGAAAASAAVMTEGTELCRRSDVDRLLEQTVLTQL